MLKVELHTHTSDDPTDVIGYSAEELIDRAAALEYDGLAITLHNRQLDVEPLRDYAAARGLVLIPGVEVTVGRKHVLLVNFTSRAEQVTSFDDIAALKRDEPRGLVVAPHPFFPAPSCLHGALSRHAALFDAVEVNAMFSPWVDFNRPARRWAQAKGVPLVGNCDVHRLEQLGSTYSLVDAEPSPDAICTAIRQGRLTVTASPLTLIEAGWMMAKILPTGAKGRWRRATGRQSATGDATRP